MSRLFLHCELCGRKQADGLLSRGHWGHVEVSTGHARACPTCKQQHADWESKLRASLDGGMSQGDSAGFGTADYGAGQSPA